MLGLPCCRSRKAIILWCAAIASPDLSLGRVSGSGSIRDAPTGSRKTTEHRLLHGHFVKLVTNKRAVEVVEFETTDPAMRGEMTITRWRMQTAARISWPCTTGCPPACRRPTMRRISTICISVPGYLAAFKPSNSTSSIFRVTAAIFSSRCFTFDVPGIGSITGERHNNQAKAS